MIAPIPSAVSDQGPSVFFSRCAGSSESEISLSMDFLANSWLARSASLAFFDSRTSNQKKAPVLRCPIPLSQLCGTAALGCGVFTASVGAPSAGVLKYFQGVLSLGTSQRAPAGLEPRVPQLANLPLRLASRQLLHFWLLAASWIISRLLRRLLLPRRALCLFAFFSAQCFGICHSPVLNMKLVLRFSAGPSARAVLRTGMVYPRLSAFIRGRNLLRLFPALRTSPPASSTRISGIVQ